jgi:hypothetical protein
MDDAPTSDAALPSVSRVKAAAVAGVALVLAVALAGAAIRLNSGSGARVSFLDEAGVRGLRVMQRVAESLEAVIALWLGWSAWRARAQGRRMRVAVALVLALTAFLAAVGILGGRSPAPLAVLGMLLGGLGLAAGFAWVAGAFARRAAAVAPWLAAALGGLLALQAVLGARLSIFGHGAIAALAAHAFLGLVLAAALWWLAFARVRGTIGVLLLVLAFVLPATGFAALAFGASALVALAHLGAAAFGIATAAAALSRDG